MLASRTERYGWARRDFHPEPPLFRVLAREWRPLAGRVDPAMRRSAPMMQRPRADERPAVSRNILFTKSKAWSPWLWVR